MADRHNFPPEWRAEIRDRYLATGIGSKRTDAIIDLAIHGVNCAFEKLGDMVKLAGDDSLSTLSLALQLMQVRAEQTHAATVHVMETLYAEDGGCVAINIMSDGTRETEH